MSRPLIHPRLLDQIEEHFLPTSIDIQSPTLVSDGQGGWTRTFVTSSTVRGRVWPLEPDKSGGEMQSADKTTMEASHRVLLRTNAVIDEDDQIVAGGMTYRVVWVAPRESHIEATLLEIE